MFVMRLQTQVHLIQSSLYSVLSCSTFKNPIVFCVICFIFCPIFESLVQGMLTEGCPGERLQASWYVLIKAPQKSENWVLFRKRNASIFF